MARILGCTDFINFIIGDTPLSYLMYWGGTGTAPRFITTFSLCTHQGIDVKSMGRIFIGLVKCGAWGCFDEFNRLEESVLSAVSMQIQVIQDAIKVRAPTAELLSHPVCAA